MSELVEKNEHLAKVNKLLANQAIGNFIEIQSLRNLDKENKAKMSKIS